MQKPTWLLRNAHNILSAGTGSRKKKEQEKGGGTGRQQQQATSKTILCLFKDNKDERNVEGESETIKFIESKVKQSNKLCHGRGGNRNRLLSGLAKDNSLMEGGALEEWEAGS